MASSVETALEEAGKVVKRQKLCSSKVADSLDKLIALVDTTRANLVAGDGAALNELAARAEQAGLLKDMNASTKELHKSINNLSKALDKAFDNQQDICKALRDVQFEQPLLNKVIAQHLYREGRFELGDAFVAEAQLAGGDGLKAPYVALHTVLQQIKRHNLGPALEWAVSHRTQLAPDGGPSGFEFKLHGLVFLNTLATGGQAAALAYAQRHFGDFRSRHMREIQRLMGCLLFADRPPSETPYADLLSPTHWDDVADEFARQACSVMGQAVDSPLAVVVAAGSVALPPLLKLASVMERGGQGPLSAVAQLPIEVELGHEFVFRSIFACPVSRDQSTPDNPPKLLPCNHVLCEQSILKIARSRSRVFKCPYCPMEARADNTRTLVFPDVE